MLADYARIGTITQMDICGSHAGISVAPADPETREITEMQKETQNTTSPGVVVEDHAHLASVEKVLTSLVKLINGKKLYADNNPRLAEFTREYEAALRLYFQVEDELVLEVDHSAIRWRDQVVYENEKREESIAFLLHKDGVGEITIGSGAVGAETELFVEILADEYHKLGSEEDVVTRFWNADFEHISYRVLDDYLSGEYAELAQLSDEGETEGTGKDHEELLPSLEDKGRVIERPADALTSIDEYLRRLIMHTCTATDEEERETYFQNMLGSFFSVSNEEIALYQNELNNEKTSDGLSAFAETVFVFVLLQDNPSAVRDVSGVLERIVEFATEDRYPETLGRLLSLVREFHEAHSLTEAVSELCQRLEQQLVAPALIAAMGELLINGQCEERPTLAYFRQIGRNAVDPLLRVLHHLDSETTHREICDSLLEILGDDATDVIERFDVDNPLIAADAVYIAGQVENPRLTASMRELVYYPDRKVKEEMISLVASMEEEGVGDLLIGAMADGDKHVRCRAMDATSQRGDAGALEKLEEIAFGKVLADRDPDEQEVIFRSLGRVGNAETVDRLEKMVTKKRLRRLSSDRDNKLLALRALEHISDTSALKLLDKLVEDSSELVQSVARRSREALGKGKKTQ